MGVAVFLPRGARQKNTRISFCVARAARAAYRILGDFFMLLRNTKKSPISLCVARFTPPWGLWLIFSNVK
jgi:hypothetical protein